MPFEATLPAGTLFLFTVACSARRAGAGWAVALFAASRARRSCCCTAWPARTAAATGSPTDASIGNRSLLIAGAGLGVVAVLAGTVLGPSVPGAESPGVLDPRSLQRRRRPA